MEDSLKARERFIRVCFWTLSLLLHLVLLATIGRAGFALLSEERGERQFDVLLPPAPKIGPAEPSPFKGPKEPPEGKEVADDALAALKNVRLRVPRIATGELSAPVISVPGKPGGEEKGLYGSRFGQAKQAALGRWGGNQATESALQGALRWLAGHQTAEGFWVPNPGPELLVLKDATTPGLTGLALLAFLAAGNTPTEGNYARNVARGLQFLLKEQTEEGCFFGDAGSNPKYTMYNHAIATLAVAEVYNLTGNVALIGPLRKALDFIAATQQTRGGWDYYPARTGRNDTSVTCWVAMALISAHNARIDPPERTWLGLISYLEQISATGWAAYGIENEALTNENPRRFSILAAVLFCKRMLGWDVTSSFVRAGVAQLSKELPRPEQMTKGGPEEIRSFHHSYWYYGTLAMFQVSGDAWENWNDAMQRTMISMQVRQGADAGSWAPTGNDARSGGRTYATALGALDLAIYYRYLPVNELKSAIAPTVCAHAVRDEVGNVKPEVVMLLTAFGGASVPVVADVLNDIRSPKLSRQLVAHILSHGDQPRDILMGVVAKSSGEPPGEILNALLTLGESTVGDIVGLWPRIPDESPTKVSAVRYLSDYAARPAVAAVLDGALSSKSDFVRIGAAQALLPGGSDNAWKALRELAASDNPFIRHKVIETLPDRKDARVLSVLLVALEDPDEAIRRIAYEKLVKIAGAFEFDPAAGPAQRKQSIDKLRAQFESLAPADPAPTQKP